MRAALIPIVLIHASLLGCGSEFTGTGDTPRANGAPTPALWLPGGEAGADTSTAGNDAQTTPTPDADATIEPDSHRDAVDWTDDGSEIADDVGVDSDADAGVWIDASDSGPDSGPDPPPECPDGFVCVESFPFSHLGDTALLTESLFDSYACKPSADESGPDVVYQITVTEPGFLSTAVYDDAGVDIDVHILSALDAESCIDRGDSDARADVEAGTYFIVVDTYVSDGIPLAGFYQVDIGFTVPSEGLCDMETGIMKRVGDGGDHLEMPATGPVVMEAHLVTQEEPQPYPTTSTEELIDHYLLSQSATGFVMYRDQSWAPLEGGSFYGAGIGSPTAFPVIDEAWYVCMFWTSESRPDKGTKMIMRDPDSAHAVVVAAGYETGPGNLQNIGGTVEETHYYLGSGHKSELTLGIATDQSIPFGPRICQ